MKFLIMAWEYDTDHAAFHQGERHPRVQRHVQALNRIVQKQGAPGASGLTLSFGLTPEAKTLRRTGGKPLVLDGPFAETKEQLAGFDIIEFDSRAHAIEYAKDAFVHESHVTEIRPVLEMWWNQRGRLPAGAKLFVLLFRDEARPASCGGGDAIVRHRADAARSYLAQHAVSDGFILGAVRLRPSAEAAAVRMRAGSYAVTDGPFAETREAVGGLNILACASLDEALEWAGKFSARDGDVVEVREIGGGGSFFYHG